MLLFLPSIGGSVELAIEWEPVLDARVGYYDVRWGIGGRDYQWSQRTLSTRATLRNLAPGKTYHVAIRACAFGGASCSRFSEEIKITPVSATPAADGLLARQPLNQADAHRFRPSIRRRDGAPETTKRDLVVIGRPSAIADASSNVVDGERAKPSVLPLEFGEILIDTKWQWVKLTRSFTDPVVVVKPIGGNDTDPALVRVDAVARNGFLVRLREWAYQDNLHTEEPVGYLVAERGVHELRDGSRIEADLLSFGDPQGSEAHWFAANFRQAPVVVSAVVSRNDDQPVTTRMHSISAEGFEVLLQTEQSEQRSRVPETVAYIAWEPSAGTIEGRPYEVGLARAGVTDEASRVDFVSGFEEPPVLLADMQTTYGGDVANLRWQRKRADAVELWVDEEQSYDDETRHTKEAIGYIALTPPPKPALEVAEITVGSDWQTVNFEQRFSDPVVIAKMVSSNDPDPVVVRIHAVNAAGFDIRLQEWEYLDDRHAPETVVYLAAERGSHQIPDGMRFEAGRIETDATHRFATTSYQSAFASAPVVVTAVTSLNGAEAVTTRVANVGRYGFDVALEEEQAGDQIHAVETVSYFAFEPGMAVWDRLHFEVGRTENEVTDALHTQFYAALGTQPPLLLADMQSCDGHDSASLRTAFVDADAVGLWVQEELSADSESRHTTETVGHILMRNVADILP